MAGVGLDVWLQSPVGPSEGDLSYRSVNVIRRRKIGRGEGSMVLGTRSIGVLF